MPYAVELTDTFGGEANYCWVSRATIHDPVIAVDTPRNEQRAVMRRAKAAVGMTGVRGITQAYGDGYAFRPYRMCQVMFVTWTEEDAADD